MSSTALPTITLLPPPSLTSSKVPFTFDISMFPTVICAVVVGFFFFATIWLHKSENDIVLEDEYDRAMYAGEELEDIENGSGVGSHGPAFDTGGFEPGPEYGSLEMPKQALKNQRSRRPSDWSHTIGTDECNNAYWSSDYSGPSSGSSYSTAPSHTNPLSSSNGRNITPVRSPPPRPQRHPHPPPPLPNQTPVHGDSYPEIRVMDATGRKLWQQDNRLIGITGSDSIVSDWTGTTNERESSPSRLILGSDYQGSELMSVNTTRPLSEDYTGINQGR